MFRWVVVYYRDYDLTIFSRFSDLGAADEEAAMLREFHFSTGVPDSCRLVTLDAEDFDAAIGLTEVRFLPPGVTVYGICGGCGGWIMPLEDEKHRDEKKATPTSTRPRPRGHPRGIVGARSGRRPL